MISDSSYTPPAAKRVLVSADEIRGKVFTKVTRDFYGIMLANDSEFYRLSFVHMYVVGQTDINDVLGDLNLLTQAPLDVQVVGISMPQKFIDPPLVDNIEGAKPDLYIEDRRINEVYRFSTNRGSVDIDYDWKNDTKGYFVCIKCSSMEDAMINWSVDRPTSGVHINRSQRITTTTKPGGF